MSSPRRYSTGENIRQVGGDKIAEAAFYSVKKSLTVPLKLKDELRAALCLAGKNPTIKFIDSVWNEDGIDLPKFSNILSKVESLDEVKLSIAFSKLSPKKKKSIPRDQLTSILSSCGEALSEEEIQKFLDSILIKNPEIVDHNGEITYQHLSNSLVKAANEARQRSLNFYEQHNVSEAKKIVRTPSGSTSSRRRRASINLQKSCETPSNIQHWTKSIAKGVFFFDDDEDASIISHQYQIEILEPTSVYFTVKSTLNEFQDSPNPDGIDTRILILTNEDNSSKFSGFTHAKNENNEYVCRTELQKGSYIIIPFTTGCRFNPKHEASGQSKLLQMVNGKPILLENFKATLSKIFSIMDLDGNHLLSRQEFNLFNWRTSGEEVADDEWAVVQENFELDNDELTLNGFLDLHQMEAEDSNGEDDDLWVTLRSMGFNGNLQLKQACPFQINAYTPKSSLKFEVLGIKSGGHAFTKALTRFVIENGTSSKVKDLQDLTIHQFNASDWSCFIVQNKSHSVVSVRLDCSESTNCISHQRDLDHVVNVGPKTSLIAHHLMPVSDEKPWKVKCSETIIK